MKFQSNPLEEHAEVPVADDGRWEDVLEAWSQRAPQTSAKRVGENACYAVSIVSSHDGIAEQAQLAELCSLIRSQGDDVVGAEVVALPRPDPRTLLKKGVCTRVAEAAREVGANLLIVDAELSPSQTRNLEDATGLAVSDREAVILNVFMRHARSKRARIQVEVAQLQYLRPRIRGLGLDMDQQVSGMGPTRGPGETASELVARKLDTRLLELQRQLERLQRAATTQRKQRQSCRRVALVGYTNAGKTTLMNALTGAELSARDAPFETLDSTSRCLTRHGGEVLLTDTVGFIRRLPERLTASFESTLADVREADLLAVVVDASDPEAALHIETTNEVLARIGAERRPRLYVFNKTDRLENGAALSRYRVLCGGSPMLCISAHEGDEVDGLREQMLRTVWDSTGPVSLFVPYSASAVMAQIYRCCRVVSTESEPAGLRFEIDGDRAVIEGVRRALETAKEGGHAQQ